MDNPKKLTLVNQVRQVLFCISCEEVICPYCFIDDDGELVESNQCQGHLEDLTDECNHGGEEEEAG